MLDYLGTDVKCCSLNDLRKFVWINYWFYVSFFWWGDSSISNFIIWRDPTVSKEKIKRRLVRFFGRRKVVETFGWGAEEQLGWKKEYMEFEHSRLLEIDTGLQLYQNFRVFGWPDNKRKGDIVETTITFYSYKSCLVSYFSFGFFFSF